MADEPKVETYDNGAVIVRGKGGRFLPGSRGANEITPATARSLALKRWENHRERVRERVTQELASTFPGVQTPEDAYAEVVAAQTMTLVGSEKPRFDDVRQLGEIMGAVPARAEATAETQQQDDSLRETLAQLAEIARAINNATE